jgi:hypothetical protein
MACRNFEALEKRLNSLTPLLERGAEENNIHLTSKKVMLNEIFDQVGVTSVKDIDQGDDAVRDTIKAYGTLGSEPVIEMTLWGGLSSSDVRDMSTMVSDIATEYGASILVMFDDLGSFVIYSIKTGKRTAYLFGIHEGVIAKSRPVQFSPNSFGNDMAGINQAGTNDAKTRIVFDMKWND